jgi:hypothetical protein
LRLIVLTASTLPILAGPTQASENASKARQEEVAKRGTQVMSFSLERTVHIFAKTKSGGIQQVIVKDKSDSHQIMLIRKHLSKIAKEFSHGNFSDPAKIHGKDMPGLAELEKARPDQLRIVYKKLAKGAQIEYSSDNSGLIDAIHRWFDAQLADHAGALPGPIDQDKQ